MDRGAAEFETTDGSPHTRLPMPAPLAPRHSRKLFDRILVAFHNACDLGDFDVADQLLHVLEIMTTRRPRPEDGNRRRSIEGLVAAHERLWYLRHPTID